MLNRKKGIQKKNPEEMRRAQRELKDCIKDSYRRKLERKLQTNDMEGDEDHHGLHVRQRCCRGEQGESKRTEHLPQPV